VVGVCSPLFPVSLGNCLYFGDLSPFLFLNKKCAVLLRFQKKKTPMELIVRLGATDGEPLIDPTCYRHIVRSLVYHSVTHSNISCFVHILSQIVSVPTQLHYSHMLRALRYLRETTCVIYSFHAQVLYNCRPTKILSELVSRLRSRQQL
jgi:hypothetical protein